MSHFQTKYIICILANDMGFLKAEVWTRQWVVTSKLMTSALHFTSLLLFMDTVPSMKWEDVQGNSSVLC
jgi:hypothetical protein